MDKKDLSTLDFIALIKACKEKKEKPQYQSGVKTVKTVNGLQIESTSLALPNGINIEKLKNWLTNNGFNCDEIYETVCDVLTDLGLIVPRPRKLHANWSVDTQQDFAACQNMDIEEELHRAMVAELTKNIRAKRRRATGL